MRLFITAAVLSFALISVTTQLSEAPTGFDNNRFARFIRSLG
jgi:hypothetical protein